jgi:hypothetical protein
MDIEMPTARILHSVMGLVVMLGMTAAGNSPLFAQDKVHDLSKSSSAQSESKADKPLAPFASFRAVYDIELAPEANKAGVSALEGRMVYELNGSVCDGYALTHRFVTRVDLSEGQTSLTDLRSASFENPVDRSFQFITQTLVDQELTQTSRGLAVHDKDFTYVALSEPEEDTFDLPKDVLFPIEFTETLLKAAVSGERFFEATIYDGTDTGNLVFDTTAVIGVAKSNGDLSKTYKVLDGLRHWPVTIAYFETGKDKDNMAPVYEISMELYENGVSGGVQIDYPDFSLVGVLSELKILQSPPCESGSSKSAK